MYINSVSSRAQEKQPWCKTLLYVCVSKRPRKRFDTGGDVDMRPASPMAIQRDCALITVWKVAVSGIIAREFASLGHARWPNSRPFTIGATSSSKPFVYRSK